MGCSVSFFKKFCQRIRRPKRDRWVRDDGRRLLPDRVEPTIRPNYGAIPKRIERQVIEDIVAQDLPRRLPDDRPEWNMYEEIHRQLIGSLFQHHQAGGSSAAFEDSKASWVGNEERGTNSKVVGHKKKNESERYKSRMVSSGINWRTDGTSEARWALAGMSEQVARYDVEQGTTNEEGDDKPMGSWPYEADQPGIDEDVRYQREMEQLFAEYRQKMAQHGDPRDPLIRGEDDVRPASYDLERYDVVVHSCSSNDASWINKWFPS